MGTFEVYLPPLNQQQCFEWHHYLVARVTGCLATDIPSYNFLETRPNIDHRHNIFLPTPHKLIPKHLWSHTHVAMVHGCLATKYIYLATNAKLLYFTISDHRYPGIYCLTVSKRYLILPDGDYGVSGAT